MSAPSRGPASRPTVRLSSGPKRSSSEGSAWCSSPRAPAGRAGSSRTSWRARPSSRRAPGPRSFPSASADRPGHPTAAADGRWPCLSLVRSRCHRRSGGQAAGRLRRSAGQDRSVLAVTGTPIPLLAATVSTPELILFAVLGLALAAIGGAMTSNIGGFGDWLLDHFIPNLLRMGSAESDRRTFGWGYLLVGLVVAVVCLTRLV